MTRSRDIVALSEGDVKRGGHCVGFVRTSQVHTCVIADEATPSRRTPTYFTTTCAQEQLLHVSWPLPKPQSGGKQVKGTGACEDRRVMRTHVRASSKLP